MLKSYCVLIIFHISVVLAEKAKPKPFYELFHQHEYKVNFERVELYRYTKRFYNNLSVITYKYNRTTPVVNITCSYKVEIGHNMEAVMQAYKFASNEYRIFPARFQINMCTALKSNIFGLGQTSTCGNYTTCYMHKDIVYQLCNWAPNQYKFPPGFPTGKYMVEVQALYFSEELFVLRGYGEITRPIPIPK